LIGLGRSNIEQRPHPPIDTYMPVRRFHFGDARLAGTDLRRQRGRGFFDKDGNALPVITVFDKFTRH